MRTVYLAGPITGCDRGEANTWRHKIIPLLADHDIVGVSPLRCEPLIGERYNPNYADPMFGTSKAIAAKNFNDVLMCDMTLCYLPREINDRRPSYGTIIELAWANMARKPTIVVSDCPIIRAHPVISAATGWMLDDLEQAMEVIIGVLGIYAKGF